MMSELDEAEEKKAEVELEIKDMEAELHKKLKVKPFDEKQLRVIENENGALKREQEGLERDIAKIQEETIKMESELA